MATEASKTRAIWGPEIHAYLEGHGIDIGCGPDPVLPTVDRFDLEHGDAGVITRFVQKRYDFVFSSHCLEHLADPKGAILEWFELVKPGGHLIVIVPDEDLYEQGSFPSVFNPDHKWTFTLAKEHSWSARSINVLELVKNLEKVGGELTSAVIHDHGLDRSLLMHRPSPRSVRLGRLFRKWANRWPGLELPLLACFRKLGAAIDQTGLTDPRLAQIQFIVKRN